MCVCVCVCVCELDPKEKKKNRFGSVIYVPTIQVIATKQDGVTSRYINVV
jgi:hypothetical protein